MINTTARTGPTTQIKPSSSSVMGWGSRSIDTTGSEYGLVAYMVYKNKNSSSLIMKEYI